MSADNWFAEAERFIIRGDVCARKNDWRGAYGCYGSAVEYALKALYLRNTQQKAMPMEMRSAATHDLTFMARKAGLEYEISRMPKYLKRNWAVVRDWDQGRRYPNEPFPAQDGKDLKVALLNPTNGVWRWLRNLYQTN